MGSPRRTVRSRCLPEAPGRAGRRHRLVRRTAWQLIRTTTMRACARRPRAACGRWPGRMRASGMTSGQRSGRWSPAGAAPAVIVSPLLALMRNQIEAAGRAGIHARSVNSANIDEWDQVYAEVAAGAVDVLLVSPERLNNPGFRDRVLPKLIAAAGMLVVDEAHCISDLFL